MCIAWGMSARGAQVSDTFPISPRKTVASAGAMGVSPVVGRCQASLASHRRVQVAVSVLPHCRPVGRRVFVLWAQWYGTIGK